MLPSLRAKVAYCDTMALDTNWCRLPRMNNIIAGITVKCSHSHSLTAEMGPLGPSREHLLQLRPLSAAQPSLGREESPAHLVPNRDGGYCHQACYV